ncbi:hypothetical protein AAFF_G00164600 [Aldrovandia affinis]|uniref:SRCR domain-containing protein n=1 Tax=Aldrovandia affinis TaxID=143900 RepID=A0AAD7T0Q8_9TELE|nr:hypothetical protein AAFF_G00164600 [Aldrovandia affinis]
MKDKRLSHKRQIGPQSCHARHDMELLKLAIVLQVLSLCQALLKTTASSQNNVSQPEGTDEPVTNQTDVLTPQLSSNCSGTLEVFLRTSWVAVLLTPQSTKEVANQICGHLGCVSAYSISHSSSHNGTCITDCTYSNFQLRNCTKVPQSNCTNVTEIVCGSLEAQDTTVVTVTTGPATTAARTQEAPPILTPAEVGCVALSLLLLMALVMNALLCWRYRKRERRALEQNKENLQSTEQQDNEYQSNDKSTADVTGDHAPCNPRRLGTQRNVDNFSITSDYKPHDHSAKPAVALTTFKNSLQNRAENRSPTLKPWSLYCLTEEGDNPVSGLADEAALPRHHKNVGSFRTLEENHTNSVCQTKNLAIPAVDPFDSSSTSSGEFYENTGTVAELQIQGDALPVKMTEGDASFQPQTERCDSQLVDSFDSSSTSSGEFYENTGPVAKLQIQGDLSSTSSGDDYDIPEGEEKPLCPAAIDNSNRSSSDSDYDDIASYIL